MIMPEDSEDAPDKLIFHDFVSIQRPFKKKKLKILKRSKKKNFFDRSDI